MKAVILSVLVAGASAVEGGCPCYYDGAEHDCNPSPFLKSKGDTRCVCGPSASDWKTQEQCKPPASELEVETAKMEAVRTACTGSDDPKGTFPQCYEGSAGAFGVKEDVKVSLLTYADGKGTLDLTGSGIEGITCKGKSFTKSGQTISPAISDCLPSVVEVKSVNYCSDTDTVAVTVKDTKVPIPISCTLKKVACASGDVVV